MRASLVAQYILTGAWKLSFMLQSSGAVATVIARSVDVVKRRVIHASYASRTTLHMPRDRRDLADQRSCVANAQRCTVFAVGSAGRGLDQPAAVRDCV
ncbi:hypothetical protein BDW22DRAFT_1355457 [Trametopsis cervina]|nr:hypothetical protein BDW22DRAFT_1355457 [Trametopsis cervina]